MIIGLSGLAGSGKDTVASFIAEKHEFDRVSFAGALKDATAAVFSWPRELLEGDTNESRDWREQVDTYWSAKFGYAVTPRTILQQFGTNVCREHLNDNIWIYCVEKKLQENNKNKLNTVITDVRFPNEIKMIKQAGGKCFHVKRGPEPKWWHLAKAANGLEENFKNDVMFEGDSAVISNKLEIEYNLHISEWAWVGSSFDSVINNNSTLEALDEKVTNLLAVYDFFGKDI
jgi:hypothetical protein